MANMTGNGGASDAQLAEMMATAIALTTAYSSADDGYNEVIDMLDGLIPEGADATTTFTEAFKVVQGLLGVVTILTDWYSRATGTPHAEVIQMMARENERRRPPV